MGTHMGPRNRCMLICGIHRREDAHWMPWSLTPFVLAVHWWRHRSRPQADVHSYVTFADNFHSAPRYTAEISDESLTFLDILVGIISTAVHYKRTDSHSCLEYKSSHHRKCKNPIPYTTSSPTMDLQWRRWVQTSWPWDEAVLPQLCLSTLMPLILSLPPSECCRLLVFLRWYPPHVSNMSSSISSSRTIHSTCQFVISCRSTSRSSSMIQWSSLFCQPEETKTRNWIFHGKQCEDGSARYKYNRRGRFLKMVSLPLATQWWIYYISRATALDPMVLSLQLDVHWTIETELITLFLHVSAML